MITILPLAACKRVQGKTTIPFFFFLFLSPLLTLGQAADTMLAARTNALETRLGLHTNGSFYLIGQFNPAATTLPVEGAGTRFIWHPDKSAFRAGTIDGTQWDDANIGLNSLAIGENVRASGDNSVALGRYCTAAQQCAFAMGDQNTATGAASVALGYHAHTNARQGSFVFADRSTIDTLRAGVNHSASWRVSGGFRLFTASNLSTGMTFQSGASVSNWGQANAVISTSTGAMLTTSGVWTNASDVNRKHLFETISGEEILRKLRSLSIQKWSYKSDQDDVKHIGPTAQDFYSTFHLGSDDKSIGTVDADGIALAAVKELDNRTISQSTELEAMRKENEALRKRLEMLENNAARNNASLPLISLLLFAGIAAGALFLKSRKARTV